MGPSRPDAPDAALFRRRRRGDRESNHGGALGRPVAQHPFELSFDGLGFFPSRGAPRVLWLGIARVSRAATASARWRCAGARWASWHERSHPHLTLARFRTRPRATLRRNGRDSGHGGTCRIDRVTLYESRLSQAGPSYTPLAEALLAGREPSAHFRRPGRGLPARVDPVRVSTGATPSRYRSAPRGQRQRRRRQLLRTTTKKIGVSAMALDVAKGIASVLVARQMIWRHRPGVRGHRRRARSHLPGVAGVPRRKGRGHDVRRVFDSRAAATAIATRCFWRSSGGRATFRSGRSQAR